MVYNFLMSLLRICWKCKWLFAVVGLFFLGNVLLYSSRKSRWSTNLHNINIPKDTYDYVLRTWYNYSKIDQWYNKKNISFFDEKLLEEIREHWIVKVDNNITYYSGLYEMNNVDPSMGQAEVIKTIFDNKRNGFFIECGAYDGEIRSNTLNLERFFDWTGLLIEADPINFTKMFMKNRKAFLSPTCLSIKPRPMNASFLMADNIGRIHSENQKDNELENSGDIAYHGIHIDVQCFPLVSYIAALNIKTVDYFSLDVEGNELDILKTIPFDKVDIKTLSVEYTHVKGSRQEIIDFMEKNGYYIYSYVTHEDNLANDIVFVKRI